MNSNPHQTEILALCDVIRETSYQIHNYLRSGHREQIYENALVHRLRKQGITAARQQQIRVFDEDGTVLGFLRADLLIDSRLICEIKGVSTIIDEHIAQVLGYLRASRIEHALLINFGAPHLQIRKLIFTKFD